MQFVTGDTRPTLLIATVAVATLLGGCTTIRDHRGYIADTALVSSVQPGIDNRQSVEGTLGRPTFVGQFGEPVWYYVSSSTSQRTFGQPKISDHAVLRVTFDPSGNVVGVDRTGLDLVRDINPDGDSTPTLGRDRGFFEDLFGNIGAVGAPGANPTGPGPNGS